MEPVAKNGQFIGYTQKIKRSWQYAYFFAPHVWYGPFKTKKSAIANLEHGLLMITITCKKAGIGATDKP
jgi:hypothetical protein